MKKIIFWITPGILVLTVFLAALWMYSRNSISALERQENVPEEYERHYALISRDQSDFWQSFYEDASEVAEREKVSLEWIGNDSPVEYSTADCMRIATASGVDGIILYNHAGDDLTDLINKAAEKGIPVIMVFNDDSQSSRMSFVGINNYQMGEFYGRQVADAMKSGLNRIGVLMNPANSADFNLMYPQMVQTIENLKQPDQEFKSTIYEIDTSSSFDADEDIRDIFVKQNSALDILVCLDFVSTECICQALVDYNQVGNMTAIGYYASDIVTDAVAKGIVKATLGIDTMQIGEICIHALDEYWSLGYASNYFNISLSVITGKEAQEMVRAREAEAAGAAEGQNVRVTEEDGGGNE